MYKTTNNTSKKEKLNNLSYLEKIKNEYKDEIIPQNDDINIKQVEFRVSSAQMATQNLNANMFK